ncbi:MAG: DUF3782 domain-containing protein [Thermocladium sp.]
MSSSGALSNEEKKRLLKAIQEDEEFRYAVAGLLGLDAILNDLRKLREEFNKYIEKLDNYINNTTTAFSENDRKWEENFRRWAENDKRWEENDRKWEENFRRWAENDKRWEENDRKWEENFRRWAENDKRWEENDRKWEENFRRWAENDKRWEENDRKWEMVFAQLKTLDSRVTALEQSMDSMNRRISAIGARWGILSESAFRRGMRAILRDVLGIRRVSKLKLEDEEGIVYGHPSIIDVDIAVRNGEHLLIEIKANANRSDVAEIKRVGDLYEKLKGTKPRLIIIAAYTGPGTKELAEKLGVELHEGV